MAEYAKVFDNPYPNGWENLPSETTPITASALQEHTDAIEHIETYLDENPIKDSTDVSWNQIQTSGSKIAEITIDGQKKDVYAPEGGGISFETGNELVLENDKLRYKANYGTTSEFNTFKQRSDVPVGATYHVTDDYSESGEKPLTERVLLVSITETVQNKTYAFSENAKNFKKLAVITSRGNSVVVDVDILKVIDNGTFPVGSSFEDNTGNYKEGFNGSIIVSNGNINEMMVINTYLKGWSARSIQVYGFR